MAGDLMLVTGGAGFIGSNLVEALLDRGEAVRVVDNLSTGRRENVERFGDRIDFLEGDLCDPDVARRACEGANIVFHVAALPGVPASIENPGETARHGVLATVNVLAAARDAEVGRVVFSSSCSVYGGGGTLPQKETARPCPGNPYAASKLCCEIYVRTFAETFGLDGVSLRYFNVFGPRQPVEGPYSAIFPAFITRMLAGERPVIFGDGLQTRDFTYVCDVAAANVRAAECEAPAARAHDGSTELAEVRQGGPAPFRGEVVNVGTGRQTTPLDLVAMINRELGTNIAPLHEAERSGDARASGADVTLARELIGHEAEFTVERGLGPTIDYFRELGAAPA